MTDPSVRQRAYATAYAEWFSALPEAEQKRLKDLGLDQPEMDRPASPYGEQVEDRAAPPEPSVWHHPMDDIESTPEQENELATAFGAALAWCCAGRNIVEIGQRYLAVLHVWRPSLVAGLTVAIERKMIAEFRGVDGGQGGKGGGEMLGPVLEWARRGTSLAKIGQRLLAMAYVVRADIIEGATLAQIGAHTNKTRQAIDRLVQDFRDTFGGMRSRSMRSEENRIRCRNSQLQLRRG